MKKIVLLTFSLLLFQIGFGQNLVPNPSFEQHSSCICCPGQISLAVPWFVPDLSGSSTDYFNSCAAASSYFSIPDNIAGYQFARTGVAYGGFSPYFYYRNPPPHGAEYLEVQLTNPLQGGKKYVVSFYVSCGDNVMYATDAIGAYLSKTAVYRNNPLILSQYHPQVENMKGSVIKDTANWVLISGSFFAQGGEEYLTIGNFNDSTLQIFKQNNNINLDFPYYYIDDVSVIEDTSNVEGISEAILGKAISVYPNPITSSSTLHFSTQLNNAELIICDILGKEMMRKRFSGNELKIEKGNLQSGVYFVKVNSENKQWVQKIIVE